MAEESFPILEQPLNDKQWKSVTMGIGDGVLDEGGNPYRLEGLSNTTNTGIIRVDAHKGYAHAILKGFYHKIDSDVTVSLPAVDTETTYSIVLAYDPLNQTKPVTLKVVKGLDRTSGKEYLVLWTVTRKPNQLLTDSLRIKQRQTITPNIQVDYKENLPESTSVLWGTQAHCVYTGETYRASWSGWKPMSPERIDLLNMPGWDRKDYSGGMIATPVRGGYLCTFTAGFIRAAAPYELGTRFEGVGNTLGTLIPTKYCPPQRIYALATAGDIVLETAITSSGQLQARSRSGRGMPVALGWGLSLDFTWFAPEAPNIRA